MVGQGLGASSSTAPPPVKVTGENAMSYAKKNVGNYQLPEPLVDAYRKKGLNTLYDWQAECLHSDPAIL